ncbi:MAG: SAM-dependent chlorinase/fluorinase [Flavobacteriales bacterium]|nr:SAM-dependent chlorinase/fluorinase [Flavobacteriales bacterium]
MKAACHIARGGTVEVLGRKVNAVREQLNVRPVVMDDTIKGEVIHIDYYGNVVTNITQSLFSSVVKHRNFKISFGRPMHDIRRSTRLIPMCPMVNAWPSSAIPATWRSR